MSVIAKRGASVLPVILMHDGEGTVVECKDGDFYRGFFLEETEDNTL